MRLGPLSSHLDSLFCALRSGDCDDPQNTQISKFKFIMRGKTRGPRCPVYRSARTRQQYVPFFAYHMISVANESARDPTTQFTHKVCVSSQQTSSAGGCVCCVRLLTITGSDSQCHNHRPTNIHIYYFIISAVRVAGCCFGQTMCASEPYTVRVEFIVFFCFSKWQIPFGDSEEYGEKTFVIPSLCASLSLLVAVVRLLLCRVSFSRCK